AAAGDPLLHDDGVVADERCGALVERDQLRTVLRLPGLGLSKFVDALAKGRFQNNRKAAIDPLDLAKAARLKTLREIDPQLGRALIGEAFVVSPLDRIPVGR